MGPCSYNVTLLDRTRQWLCDDVKASTVKTRMENLINYFLKEECAINIGIKVTRSSEASDN
jgi:hypothetical protein